MPSDVKKVEGAMNEPIIVKVPVDDRAAYVAAVEAATLAAKSGQQTRIMIDGKVRVIIGGKVPNTFDVPMPPIEDVPDGPPVDTENNPWLS